MWTSIDLEQEYKDLGGQKLTRKKIVERVLAEYKNDFIMLLCSPGFAIMHVFKAQASNMLRMQKADDDDDVHTYTRLPSPSLKKSKNDF